MSEPGKSDVVEYGASSPKSWAARVVPWVFALAGGLTAVYANVHFVKLPDTPMDWAVQICGGVTFAIIIFFVVWGHFQGGGEEG